MNVELLKLSKEYKYKELCEILEEPVCTGKSKQLQLNRWKKHFNWNNPTTQKFIVTEIYEVPIETIRKPKLQDEFEYIFNCFLSKGINIREYNRDNKYWNENYFNNDNIYKFFGCYANLYAAMEDENINRKAFNKLADKIREKARYYIYDKINKLDWTELGYGIIAYPDKDKLYKYEYKDEFLEQWNQYKEDFIKENKLGFEMNVIKQGRWQEMIEYISDKFEDYDIVKRYHKVTFDIEKVKDYDYNKYKECRNIYNETIIKEIYEFLLKKEKESYEDDNTILEAMGYEGIDFNEEKVMQPYKYIIDNYIEL